MRAPPVFAILLCASCSSGSSSTGSTGGACVTLPANATRSSDTPDCKTPSGTWTFYDLDTRTNVYLIGCTEAKSLFIANQADFDAVYAKSNGPATTAKSNEDFVLGADCASGSLQIAAPGTPEYKQIVIFTKGP